MQGFLSLLTSIYASIAQRCSGFIVRAMLTSMVSIVSVKVTPQSAISKECAVTVIGIILKERFSDCGNQVTDCISVLSKLCRVSPEQRLREAIFLCLATIVQGAGIRIQDTYSEIIRLVSKYVGDKAPEVRESTAVVLKSLVGGLAAEQLLSLTSKGLEDENGSVQCAFAETVAAIFLDQINAFAQSQEQAKVGIARGTTADSESQGPAALTKSKSAGSSRLSIAKLREFSSQPKKILETYEFKSVVGHILKQIVKSNGALRAGYIAALGFLVAGCVLTLSDEDFEWLIVNLIGIFHEPSVAALPLEDTAFFRARISFLLRSSIIVNLSEPKLRLMSTILTKFVSSLEDNGRGEAELQLALNSLEVIATTLRSAGIAIVEEVIAATSVYLRHASFGVRSTAAALLSSLSVLSAGIAVDLLRNAVSHTRAQAKQLLVHDGSDSTLMLDINALEEGLSPTSPDSNAQSSQSSKKKNARDTERLQRMFFFHGNTLLISKIMRYAGEIPTGLPSSLILDLYDLGLDLLQLDVLSTPPPVRNVSCSIVRAGSLIISSCISLGYKIARYRLDQLLQICNRIFKSTDETSVVVSNEDVIYEIMTVEAGLVCISTILLSCPEYLTWDDKYLPVIVDGLEICFRSLKGKYQPGFRTHFRFCTLHVILMECFSLLPHGFFPNSCQSIFVEALRVFRDSLAAGYECTSLSDMTSDDHKLLRKSKAVIANSFSCGNFANVGANKSATVTSTGINVTNAVLPEHLLVLKLECYATALQKKESEAFLTTFNKIESSKLSLDTYFAEVHKIHLPPSVFSSAQIDSRTIDASIVLLASTFPLQSGEYQEKAIQLCQQAVAQCAKPRE